MKITFKDNVNVSETMVFDELFEESLQLDEEEKLTLLQQSTAAVWMLVDGKLAGETYGIPLDKLAEKIEDCEDNYDSATVYCYSTALLTEFRGRGLGPF